MSKEQAVSGREDVSRFIVHLTRDDRDDFPDGASARTNLLNILKEQTILALRTHCLFDRKIEKLPTEFRKKVWNRFSTVCLTEVPLNQIHLLSRPIPGRQIELTPYGIVFNREFIVEAGGQPAIYINGYGGSQHLNECVGDLFERAVQGGLLRDPHWRILPFINAMHERYDFTWEREWRVRGDLNFRSRDIVAVILPQDRESPLKKRLAKAGIAVISPSWTYEQIVAELARQQRTTRSLTKALMA